MGNWRKNPIQNIRFIKIEKVGEKYGSLTYLIVESGIQGPDQNSAQKRK